METKQKTERNSRVSEARARIVAQTSTEDDEVFTSAYESRGAGTPQEAEIISDPFRKRPSLARTPPLKRSISLPQERGPATEDKTKADEKRKRSEDSPPETVKKPREAKAAPKNCRDNSHIKASDLIRELGNKVEDLHTITSGSRNTKVEIKELAEELLNLMKALSRVDSSKSGREEKRNNPQTREEGTQTEKKERLRSRRLDSTADITSLPECLTVEQWRGLKGKRWSPTLFSRTEVKEGGDILTTKDSVVKVIVTVRDEKGLRNRRIWERYPELQAAENDVAVLEQTSKLRGGDCASRKIIKITTDGSDEDLWTKLVGTREETAPDDWIAFQQAPGRSTDAYRKMLECVFLNTSNKIAIYTEKERPQQKKAPRTEEKPGKERDTYALVAEGFGKEPYTEVLRRVKERVRGSTMSNKIKGLRSTRDGRLLITVEKDTSVVDRVAEILGEPAHQLRISKTGQKGTEMALHIRGLDALTIKQDIVEAIEGRIGPLTGKTYRISDLRPNFGNTLAATFIINKEDAIKVIGDGTLRVGLVNCRVEKRVEVKRCFRCWSYEHKARDCDGGVDRSKLCYRCGTEGHSAKTCKNEEACPVCGVGGHTADSRKCRYFKRALMQAREAETPKINTEVHKERRTLTSSETPADEPTRGLGSTDLPDPSLTS